MMGRGNGQNDNGIVFYTTGQYGPLLQIQPTIGSLFQTAHLPFH